MESVVISHSGHLHLLHEREAIKNIKPQCHRLYFNLALELVILTYQ